MHLVQVRAIYDVGSRRSDVTQTQSRIPAHVSFYRKGPLRHFRIAKVELIGAPKVVDAGRAETLRKPIRKLNGEGTVSIAPVGKERDVAGDNAEQRVVYGAIRRNGVGAETSAQHCLVVGSRPQSNSDARIKVVLISETETLW